MGLSKGTFLTLTFVIGILTTAKCWAGSPGDGPGATGVAGEIVQIIRDIGGILATPYTSVAGACSSIEEAYQGCQRARVMANMDLPDREATLELLLGYQNTIRTFNGNYLALRLHGDPIFTHCGPAINSFNSCLTTTVVRIANDPLVSPPIVARIQQPVRLQGQPRSPLVELQVSGSLWNSVDTRDGRINGPRRERQ